MLKAIIFDFDGVIVLSDKPRFQAIQSSAQKFNITIANNFFEELIGITTLNFLNNVLTDDKRNYIDRIMTDYELTYKKHIENFVLPNKLLVNFIRNYDGPTKFAIASMSDRKVIDKILTKFDISNKFTLVVSKNDVTKQKPDPEVYTTTVSKLQIPSDQCVVIEDSPIGVTAAHAAGISCYVALNGTNRDWQFKKGSIKGFINSEKDLAQIATL